MTIDSFVYNPAQFLPFRDKKACDQARSVKREDIDKHPNENFKIRVIENEEAFRFAYVLDIVSGIKKALDEGRSKYVLILPAPNPNYALVAKLINDFNIPCHHVHTFNMDEYADEDGNTAPRSWKGGFQYWMWNDLFSQIRPELRMPENQIHFPSSGQVDNVNDFSKILEDLGGADKAYGGIGWCAHIAFYEPHIAVRDHGDDMESFLNQGTCMVDLHPITVCQNSLGADAGSAGDWSWVPPKAATIGPLDLARAKQVSFWNAARSGESSWQRFITRLAAHGPVTPAVPASMLQVVNSELILSGHVAANCSQETGSRMFPIKF